MWSFRIHPISRKTRQYLTKTKKAIKFETARIQFLRDVFAAVAVAVAVVVVA